MHATATVHIPQDVHSLYHAHSAASFDTAPRIPPARIHDLPVVALQHRMPQPPPPPPPPHQNHHPRQHSGSSTNAAAHQPPAPTPRFDKVGIPAMTSEGVVLVDDPLSQSTRSYTLVKVVGDGSFGTVWLCDWHSTLPPATPLSPMQCGAGARQEWAGKRLVALKRMKKPWPGGWEECRRLPELDSLRRISRHPNIISLYDYFLMPNTKELYFVFECMEGNLYQLIKSRKGRPLAGGLVSSIFYQVVSGLDHIHGSGYFHRDMKPENLLVTTTGLHNYPSTNPRAPSGAEERDVAVIVKLADFGLARETASRPPYTEYVSTRWYRAPEVLLRSRDYSNPVDMWALGTIMAELVNLRPLFPGQSEIDQVALICEVLGNPSEEYGVDERGVAIGGGGWNRGVRFAHDCGFVFPMTQPKTFDLLFESTVPRSLVECISDLLKYDPAKRLTSEACVQHRYLDECKPFVPTVPQSLATSQPHPRPSANGRNNASVAASAGVGGSSSLQQQGPGPSPSQARAAASLSTSSLTNGNLNVNGTQPQLQTFPPRNVPPSHSYPSTTHADPPPPPRRQQPQLPTQPSPSPQPVHQAQHHPPPHIHHPQPQSIHHLAPLTTASSGSISNFSVSSSNHPHPPHPSLSLTHLPMMPISMSAIRSPGARSDLDSIASPTSTSAPLTASSSPMSPPLFPATTTATASIPPVPPLPTQVQQLTGLGLSPGQGLGGSQQRITTMPSRGGRNGVPLQLIGDQLEDHDLPMDSLTSYGQRRHNESRERELEREFERRGSPPRHLAQQQHQQQQQLQAPNWSLQERQRGKRSGSDPDSEMAEGSRTREDVPAGQSGPTGGKGFLGLVKKNKSWGIFGGGGGDKNGAAPPLPPVEEDPSGSSPSIARSHASDGDSTKRLLDPLSMNGNTFGSQDYSLQASTSGIPHASTSAAHLPRQLYQQQAHSSVVDTQLPPTDDKKTRKELAKLRRAEEEEAQRARARAVKAKREILQSEKPNEEIEWTGFAPPSTSSLDKGKQRQRPPPSSFMQPSGVRRANGGDRARGVEPSDSVSSSVKALLPPVIQEEGDDYQQMVSAMDSGQRSRKARRRDLDDDHSMSSADTRPPNRRQSVATVDSDPGPVRPMPSQWLRERPSVLGMNRAASHSSLRSALSTGNSSLRGYSSSARSSTSLEQGFLEGFAQATVGGAGPGGVQGHQGHAALSPTELHSAHLRPYSRHPHHPHHHPRGPQSSSSSLNAHPNSLPPMLTNSQHSSSITLPPISIISNPLPPHPGLTDKGSHETLHPDVSRYSDAELSQFQTHSMFAVPIVPPNEDIQMTHHPTHYVEPKPSLPPFSEMAAIADRGAENDVGMGDAG